MKFYLYRIFDGDNRTLYVGKGCGSRLAKQKRRFAASGEIVARYADEDEAYRQEIKLIEELKPLLNIAKGGNGGRSGLHRDPAVLPNGFTPEGLALAAPHLARLLSIWRRDKSLSGILSILGSYISAHGESAISNAVTPRLKRFISNDLAVENRI